MILSVGVDLAEVDRVRAVIERHGERFLERVYSEEEIRYCRRKRSPWGSYAARFAAKEAGMKALGTGWRGVSWKEISVTRQPGAAPRLVFCGRAREILERLGTTTVHLTLTHTRDHAIAVVILEGSREQRVASRD